MRGGKSKFSQIETDGLADKNSEEEGKTGKDGKATKDAKATKEWAINLVYKYSKIIWIKNKKSSIIHLIREYLLTFSVSKL